MSSKIQPNNRARRPEPTDRNQDDAWVDQVPGPAPRASPSGTVLVRPSVGLAADHVSEVPAASSRALPLEDAASLRNSSRRGLQPHGRPADDAWVDRMADQVSEVPASSPPAPPPRDEASLGNPPSPQFRASGRPQDDHWADAVADRVSEALTEEALELELVVFYDKVTETLHAGGYDGAASRYFRSLEDAQSLAIKSPEA